MIKLTQLHPPHPSCPNCNAYLVLRGAYSSGGWMVSPDGDKEEYKIWQCKNCSAEYKETADGSKNN